MSIHYVRRIPMVSRLAGWLLLLLVIVHAVVLYAVAYESPPFFNVIVLTQLYLPLDWAASLTELGSYLITGPPVLMLRAALGAIIGVIALVLALRLAAAGPLAALIVLAAGGWETYFRVRQVQSVLERGTELGWLMPAGLASAVLLLLTGLLGLAGAIVYRLR